jgi:hypothetical protein
MTSCPLSLKTIPAHNSSQRDIKHPLEKMSAKISLGEEMEKMERKRKRRERERRRNKKCRHNAMKRGIDWFTYGIKKRKT